jgi:4-amino-4-deoxy-L-arabinose transferase-like glycosyltransferase
MKTSRPWLGLLLAVFCLPQFVDLGRTDVGHDEAIYSFGVDRLLETGDWLSPRSSPHEDYAFLEKPPLKFWIVAAPIRAGLLPHDEFGLRFWDATFGALAFVYVFAIGCLLAGPVCGAVAVLILFSHWPLVFDHGLRSNNMESALFLSYCGGIYHFLRWARVDADAGAAFVPPEGRASAAPALLTVPRASRHAVAVALYFVLGFMTKFVAAIFLPFVLAIAVLVVRDYRIKFFRSWRIWSVSAALVVALAAPWFVWAHFKYGNYFWTTIFGEAVYRRFTTFLNPVHVQPWHYYVVTMWERFGDSGSNYLLLAGILALAIQTVRRRWAEGLVILLWLAIPTFLISFGSSKLYHYAYPFLPPAALAAGYLAALVIMLAPAPLARTLQALRDVATRSAPAAMGFFNRPVVRAVMVTIAAGAALVAAVSLVYGPIRIAVGRTVLFKSSRVFRPIAIVALFGALPRPTRDASRVVVMLLVASALPLQAYRDAWTRLAIEDHPMRSASDCLTRLESGMGEKAPGLYVDVPDMYISHPLNYYFRRVRPWTRAEKSDTETIARYLNGADERRPMLLWDTTYRNFMNAQASAESGRPSSPPMIALPDVVLLLPGPYAACSIATPARTKGH